MSRALTFGKAAIELSLLSDGIEKQLNAMEARFASFGKKLVNVGKVGLAIGGAITAPFIAGLKSFANFGDQLNKMAARTGFTAQALSELGFAAEQSGTNLEAVEKGTRGMSRMLLDAERGLSTAKDNLSDLGLTLQDFAGLSPDQKFELLADRIAGIDDPTKRAALAMKVFGKSGADLLPLLSNGVGGIAALRQEARDLGITLGDEDAQAAADFTDALNRMWRQTKAVMIQLGAAIAGPMTALISKTQSILRVIIDWIKAHQTLVTWIAATGAIITAVGAVVLTTGLTFIFLSKAITVAKNALVALKVAIHGVHVAVTVLTANPLVAIVTAIAAVVLAILWWTGALDKLFGWLGKVTGLTSDTKDGIDDLKESLSDLKLPKLDPKDLGIDGFDLEAKATGGLDAAKQAQALFDLSLARQTIGDAGLQEKQLEELKRVNKNLERQRQGVPVR